jgi:hypothetical protein
MSSYLYDGHCIETLVCTSVSDAHARIDDAGTIRVSA